MANLDGTYWLVSTDGLYYGWLNSGGETYRENARRFESAGEAKRVAAEMGYPIHRLIRIRPRVSLVVAVRRCVEAREKGVELWFRGTTTHWLGVNSLGMYIKLRGGPNDGSRTQFSDTATMLERYIVATPDDARRIDARAAKETK